MSTVDNTTRIAKKASRPPPRLRTKTGCFKCRERRKKCDEVRPICSACLHLKLDCKYPNGSRASRSPSPSTSSSPTSVKSVDQTSDRAPSSPLSTSLVVRPSSINTVQDWNLFQYGSHLYNPLLLRPDAPSQFRDFSYVFSVSLEIPWLMRAVLAPAAIHASWKGIVPKETAISYSQSALSGLKQLVQQHTPTSEVDDTLLIACIFLGVFEDFYSAPSSHTLVHYMACSKLLEKKLAAKPTEDFNEISAFYRTAIESTLYHFSTRLIFEPEVEEICKAFPWSVTTKYCQWFEDQYRTRGTQEMVLPVLGRGSPSLFLLIFQVEWLSRQFPFAVGSPEYVQALECQVELQRIEDMMSLDLDMNSMPWNETTEEVLSGDSKFAAALYILALKIYIAKIIDPLGIRSDSPTLQLTITEAYRILSLWDPNGACSQHICWPVIILGCVACPRSRAEAETNNHLATDEAIRSQMRKLIQSKLLHIWKSTFSGFVRRTASALEDIWSHRHFYYATEFPSSGTSIIMIGNDGEEIYDGLDVLLDKKGLAPRLSSEPLLLET